MGGEKERGSNHTCSCSSSQREKASAERLDEVTGRLRELVTSIKGGEGRSFATVACQTDPASSAPGPKPSFPSDEVPPPPPPPPPPSDKDLAQGNDAVVDDIAAMGFQREAVAAVLRHMAHQGEDLDANKVIDRLTRQGY